VLAAREIITRTAGLLGLRPRTLRLPIITPRLSSYWIALITRADPNISRQLVEGLRSNLVAPRRRLLELLPGYVASFVRRGRAACVASEKPRLCRCARASHRVDDQSADPFNRQAEAQRRPRCDVGKPSSVSAAHGCSRPRCVAAPRPARPRGAWRRCSRHDRGVVFC